MRIGIDASRINLKHKTGTEWYSYYIIKNILNIDLNNQYFLFSREKLPDEFLNYPNVKNIVLKWLFRKFWTLFRLSSSLRKYNLDLFFSPSHNLPFTKIKKIITWHDLGYEYYPKYYSKLQLFSLKLGARQLKKADAIITPSNFTKQDIIKYYGIGEDKIYVIPHGVRVDSTLQAALDNGYLLCIGRLEAKKNIITLIKAYNHFIDNYNYDLQLILIGSRGYGFKDIEKEINSSKHKSNIKIKGWVGNKEKNNLLKSAKVYLNLSNFEGFGMPILEAAINKVPMIISNLEAYKEFDLHDYCFTENNIEIISAKINKILSDSELRKAIIEKNYALAQQYSWQKSAEKTLKVFND